MKIFNRYILRFLIIIIIGIIFLNQRNNKCIINQNCEPYFISNKITSNKIYPTINIINYKIIDNHGRVDVMIDKNYDTKNKFILGNIDNQIKYNIDEYVKKYAELYSGSDIIDNNTIIAKKITLTNTTKLDTKIYAKIRINPPQNANLIKFYSCFCNDKITLKAYETTDLFIYYSLKDIVSEVTIEMEFNQK